LDHSAGDLSDLGDRFTGIEVDYIEGIEGVVGFAPAYRLDGKHCLANFQKRMV
jgi:hypothetical protein